MKAFLLRFWLNIILLAGASLTCGESAYAAQATVAAGQLVTLTATADGTAPFTYQWAKNGAVLVGATDSTYTIMSFQAADAGTYNTLVSNSAGSTTSDDAILSLDGGTTSAPLFSTQPQSQTVTAGGTVTFTAAATGSPSPTFQWKKDGSNILGASNTSYSIATVATGDAGIYTVVATNSVASVTSSAATLTVNAATSAPIFTTQPLSQTVTVGGGVTFTAAASGVPSPTLQWKKNGSNIVGATNGSYTIATTASGDAGSYTVVATNSVGTATSNTASLTVNPVPVAPAITTQPVSQTLVAGSSVTFTVVATGTPAPTFQWRKNGTNISGATSSSYTKNNITSSNAGTYTVVAANSAGSVTSNGAVLTVGSAPAFTTQPASQTVTVGSAVSFTVVASGSPAPTFQWKKGGVNILNATSATYTITSVITGDAASYTVVATNSISAVTSNAATLTVNAANSAPVFTTQPATQTVTAGNSVTFTAAASGSPAPTYQWKKAGINIAGATNPSYTINNVTSSAAGSYSVVAANSAGSATSNSATLTVNVAGTAPILTTQPLSQTVTAGTSATFTAAASGSPTPTYQWQKDGVNIAGATGSSFTISSPVGANEGSYTVVATNSAGSVISNTATLTVVVPPSNVVIAISIQ